MINMCRFIVSWTNNWLRKYGFKKQRVYYIGGKEALPQPLNRAEEYQLLERLDEGDQAAKATLIERNLRLVVYLARKFENTGVHIEDLISIGTIGLIKGVNTFKLEKNIKLATYASRCIENEILMFLRKTSKLKTEVSFDEPLNVDWDGNALLLSDILGTEPDVIERDIEQHVNHTLLKEALKKLSSRDQYIMTLRFGLNKKEELTQKEVADLLGISQSYISRLEKKILFQLQASFQETL